jgi:hypothetical protein
MHTDMIQYNTDSSRTICIQTQNIRERKNYKFNPIMVFGILKDINNAQSRGSKINFTVIMFWSKSF